jgi:hypothetical protein
MFIHLTFKFLLGRTLIAFSFNPVRYPVVEMGKAARIEDHNHNEQQAVDDQM